VEDSKPGWLVKIIYFALLAACLFGVFGPPLWQEHKVVELAMARAKSDPAVTQRLGQPLDHEWLVSGEVERSNNAGEGKEARLRIPISGSERSGTLVVVASENDGGWKLHTLRVEMEGDATPIDLMTKPPATPEIPDVPEVAAPSGPFPYRESDIAMFRKEAKAGDVASMEELGNLYQNGNGVEKNYEQAVAWYRKAAEEWASSYAMTSLAYMLENGLGTPKNHKKALAAYRKAAEWGDTTAMQVLGTWYLHGEGVEQDYGKALMYLREGSEKYGGDPTAMTDLASMYANGWGVQQDYVQAAAWYRKAAKKGNVLAMSQMGRLYENGWGVEKNRDEAILWYRCARQRGEREYAEPALKRLDALAQ
jgi:TPR repeat protein